MADLLPQNFPTPTGEVSFTVDYLDTIAGVGYKNFYLAGTTDSVGSKYLLTTDTSIVSDKQNYAVVGSGQDIDFDIDIQKSFKLATGTAYIVVSTSIPAGTNQILTYAIRHVSSGGVETDLATATGSTTVGAGGSQYFKKTTKMAMTGKAFKKGEKFRVNIVTNSSNANAAFYFDPSGTWTQTSESPNFSHRTFAIIPVEVGI